ncbi:DUF3857 domain-containing protein [Mucilaginibacter gotjawali]|uniref:DUF3857 domain-containing protein n=1 Tax=Mucilaginibacter gotjawali TaxID=1550579 RepID=A0A839SMY5_9SPHI|nr:DUF3857 domain-containing protein [Mucilaginibacter gotjawali]MBB3058952.1 hypothetical protein [Mucilaginibacter gotjawali]
MKKQFLPLIIFLVTGQYLFGQAPDIEKETWSAKPQINTLDNKYSKESAVIIYDSRRVEFADQAKEEIAEYYTIHKIIHINDDRGIEDFNKIYLGISEKSDIVDIRARTLLPGGKIIELDQSNIKDLKEQDGNVYKIFAMEGLEKGCEIEYFYTYKKPATFFGREVLQSIFPVLESKFQIIGPKRLKFEIKPYNFTAPASDTVIKDKRFTQVKLKATSGVEEEKYASYDANLMRVEFKLSYNDATRSGERLFTWNELAKRVFGIYTLYTDKEVSKVAELVSSNGWDKLADEVTKIAAVENYLKKNFAYNEELSSEDGNKLETVLQNKTGGTIGTLRLYSLIFKALDIKFQFVLTGNRNNYIIDKDFENWNNCENPLFYFPAENKFLAPTRPDYRYPWIFPAWGNTNGLFCKSTSLGSFSTAIAEIKDIPLEDYTKTFENIDTKLELNTSADSLTIDARQTYAGYAAVNLRDAFNFSNDEQKGKIVKELAKSVSSSEHIISSEILNQDFESAGTNIPLVLHTVTKSGELIESAGNKLLLKIGMAIGPQVEMYQEKPRQEPIDMDFAHVEERKIDFIIPKGYAISNPDDLKINETYKENGELTMGFVTDYVIKGNVLSIHIMEQYRRTLYPMNQFEQFRKIINASSDFNKVVLVLEKKG